MQGLKLSASKVSYALSNGLGQHFHKDVVKDIQDAPTVTLGTDGSTFKVGGLSKHVDISARYWSEQSNQVEDSYLDTHSFGHEPAHKQVLFSG